MEIASRKVGEALVVSVTGELNALTTKDFQQRMTEWIAAGETFLLVDLSGLEFISSAGLRSILALMKILKAENGKLSFFAMREPIREVFKISGFHRLFNTFDTEADALKQA